MCSYKRECLCEFPFFFSRLFARRIEESLKVRLHIHARTHVRTHAIIRSQRGDASAAADALAAIETALEMVVLAQNTEDLCDIVHIDVANCVHG